MQGFIEKIHLPKKIFQKTVYWENGPMKKDPYKKFMEKTISNENYKCAIYDQWSKLRQNLKQQVPQACSVNNYLNDYQTFWNQLQAKTFIKDSSQLSEYAWERGTLEFEHFI